MLFPLFVLFSPAFFVLCFVATCLLWLSMERDSGKGATGVVAVFAILITAFGGVEAWQWMYDNPGKLVGLSLWGGDNWWSLGYVWSYILLGVVWAFAHWIIFCRDDRKDYEEFKAEWLEINKVEGNKIPVELKNDWVEYCYNLHRGWVTNDVTIEYDGQTRREVNHYTLQVQQTARQNKGSIMTWMAYWPFSLTWWAARDLLRKLWERLYSMIGGTLDKISAWIYKGVEDDFPEDIKVMKRRK